MPGISIAILGISIDILDKTKICDFGTPYMYTIKANIIPSNSL